MLKRYYTLQEAAKFLTDNSEQEIGATDILELAARGKLRLCSWFAGSLMRFEANEYDSFLYELALQVGINLRGYIEIPSYMVDPKNGEIELTRVAVFETVALSPYFEELGGLSRSVMTADDYPSWDNPCQHDPEILAPYFIDPMEISDDGEVTKRGSITPTTLKIAMADCVIPAAALEALLEGRKPEKTIHAIIAERKKSPQVVVGFKELNLNDWPLMRGENSTLYNAVNKSLPWVKSAIKSNDPKLVYPAMLAILLQQENNGSSLKANPEKLRAYLKKNFPDCLDDYEAHIDFGKDDVT